MRVLVCQQTNTIQATKFGFVWIFWHRRNELVAIWKLFCCRISGQETKKFSSLIKKRSDIIRISLKNLMKLVDQPNTFHLLRRCVRRMQSNIIVVKKKLEPSRFTLRFEIFVLILLVIYLIAGCYQLFRLFKLRLYRIISNSIKKIWTGFISLTFQNTLIKYS